MTFYLILSLIITLPFIPIFGILIWEYFELKKIQGEIKGLKSHSNSD